MNLTQRTDLRPLPPGGTRALWTKIASVAIVALFVATAAQADEHGHKTRLSSDLDSMLHGTVAIPAAGVRSSCVGIR